MKPMMWVALLATVGATIWVSTQESSDVEPMVRAGKRDAAMVSKSAASPAVRKTSNADADRLDKLNQALNDWLEHKRINDSLRGLPNHAILASGDTTAWASQQPPPPPPPPPYVAPLPPPPMAPLFSHAWVGRYVDSEPRAVIAGPMQTWVVKVGDLIDSQWQVNTIGERQMTLTYLPLKQAQTVSMK